MRVFYPDIYIKTGDGIVVPATQELLTTALAEFLSLPYCETGAKIEEQKGGSIVLAGGSTVVFGKKVIGEINNLDVDATTYTAMRAYHGVACSFIFNEIFTTTGTITPTGKAYQIKNVIPKIKLKGRAGDLFRISIMFEKEGDLSTVVEDYDLT